jgi:hypothetical protein
MNKSYYKNTRKKGYCLFASRNIKKGDIVLQEPFVILPGKQWHHINATALHEYYFHRGYCFMPLGYVCLLAHAHEGNLKWLINKRTRLITFFATRSIKKHEELNFNYGWDEYPWEKNNKC